MTTTPLAQAGLIDWTIDWAWIGRHLDDIWSQTVQHVWVTAVSVGLGIVVAAGLSIVAYRHPRLRRAITSTAGIIYTIPSFAMMILLFPFTGLSNLTLIIPLTLYTLLALIRNTLAGLDGVPDEVREAALGMGYTRRRLLWRVELPMALPVIMAGIRIATVTTVGLVTIGGFLGASLGGLGSFIFDGLRRFFLTPLLIGALAPFALAMLLDQVLLRVERVIVPWNRTEEVRL